MRASQPAGARLHDALHRLPGMPAHAETAGRNSNAAAGRLHRHSLRSRPLPSRPLRNPPLRSPGAHHDRPPRVLAGWQAWIGHRFGQAHR
jgi:hypothetical protein